MHSIVKSIEHMRGQKTDIVKDVDDIRHALLEIKTDLHSSKAVLETKLAAIDKKLADPSGNERDIAVRILHIEDVMKKMQGFSEGVDSNVNQLVAAKPQDGAFIAANVQSTANEIGAVRQLVQRLETSGVVPSAPVPAADPGGPVQFTR